MSECWDKHVGERTRISRVQPSGDEGVGGTNYWV